MFLLLKKYIIKMQFQFGGYLMKEYQLGQAICQVIVDGILKGYLHYLDERKVKKQTMNVSGAYAWTKGNHIDDQISKIGQEQGLNFKIEKAGYTWEYLQFSINQASENFMIIVKNSRRITQTFDGETKKKNEVNYLIEFADINSPIVNRRATNYIQQSEQIELELSDPEEFKAIQQRTPIKGKQVQKYTRFYIVTYEIDDITKLISSIQLMLPNSITMNLDLIEDLTYLIQTSEYEITLEDVETIKNEKISDQTIFSGDDNAFGYSIPEEEKKVKGN